MDITIKNVDENGKELENVDWSVYERVEIEEVNDAEGNLQYLLSHCRKIPKEQIDLEAVNRAEQNLKESDYISSKFGDALMQCESIEEMFETIQTFKKKYGNIITNRKEWRNTINELKK